MRLLRCSLNKRIQKLTKRAAVIKTRYDAFPLGTRFGYATAIMLMANYIKKVKKIDPLEIEDTRTFKSPIQPEPHNPEIDRVTPDKDIPKMEAVWTTKRKYHEIYLRVEDAMKNLILKAYESCWPEEIEDDILKFTMVSAMEMLDHLYMQCLKVTNRHKKRQIKNMEFPWLAD